MHAKKKFVSRRRAQTLNALDIVKTRERRMWDENWKSINNTIEARSVREYLDTVKFEFLLELLPKTKESVTLECGCGGATISGWLSKAGHETFAVDFSKEALKVARRNLSTFGNFVLCDVEHLPFRKDTFDVVMSFGLFEHFIDPGLHTQVMIKVLKPNGLLFVDAVPKRFNIQAIAEKLYQIKARGKKLKPFEIRMNAKQIREFFSKFALSGLKVIGNNPFPLTWGKLPIPSKMYIKFMKKLRWLHDRFDGSWLALFLGGGLWVYGFKESMISKE